MSMNDQPQQQQPRLAFRRRRRGGIFSISPRSRIFRLTAWSLCWKKQRAANLSSPLSSYRSVSTHLLENFTCRC